MDYVRFYKENVQGLEKVGEHYEGWCPFHDNEENELKDFVVNPENGLWDCFSCRKSGNVFTFCKKMGLPVDQAPAYGSCFMIYGDTGRDLNHVLEIT